MEIGFQNSAKEGVPFASQKFNEYYNMCSAP
jgi:hypothetical protein